MSEQQQLAEPVEPSSESSGSILLGTGLALASFIILPAVAAHIGLGSSLPGALRLALMKASGKSENADACTTGFSCH